MDVSGDYSATVRLFNQEQDTLWRARAWASLTALFLESCAVAAYKMELHPHLRLGSVVSMILLPPTVYKLLKGNESDTILFREDLIPAGNQLPLSPQDLEKKEDKRKLGETQLFCVVLIITLVAFTVFTFRARKSIKMATLALSSLSFAIAYVKCPYIHLDLENLSLPTPRRDRDPVKRVLFKKAEEENPDGPANLEDSFMTCRLDQDPDKSPHKGDESP